MVAAKERYTADDVWDISTHPDNASKRFELIDGMIVELTPSSMIPGIVAAFLVEMMGSFVRINKLGYVTTAEAGYRLSDNDVLAPDVGFISKNRVAKLPERFYEGAPDLAVEVVSPTDVHTIVQRKAMKYLNNGTKLVWVVFPDDKLVYVYRPAQEAGKATIEEIGIKDTLDGGDVLPGFKLPVAEIFKVLEE